MATALLIVYILGIMPFGFYWLTAFQSPLDNDVYLATVLSWLWPLLIIPCLVIHAARKATRTTRY